ncbi:MAG: hypothetical protein KGJ60_13345 [Verrucomicrobiota bacterium]|nr:hypothetical protein [Verrucomicrobiota bacterium]
MSQTQSFGKHRFARLTLCLFAAGALTAPSQEETANLIPTLEIQANQVVTTVRPTLYGLMTEEINHSYDGGLYGELIRNRSFKADLTNAVYWNAIGRATLSLDTH